MPWDFALILAVLGALVPWRGTMRIRQLLNRPHLTRTDRLGVYASTAVGQWALAAVVFWRCSARGLNAPQLGLAIPECQFTIRITLGLILLLVAHQFLSLRRLARLPAERHGLIGQIARKLMPQQRSEVPAFLGLVTTVAVCEEFLYRGFAVAVLATAADSSLVAVLASAALFALAHLYQGRTGMLATFLVGLGFAGARIWSGSLVPSTAAHWVADLAAGLAAPRLLGSSAIPQSGTPELRRGAPQSQKEP
jgi:membrane protease YdiL (CAAX protease family)